MGETWQLQGGDLRGSVLQVRGDKLPAPRLSFPKAGEPQERLAVAGLQKGEVAVFPECANSA